MAGPNRVLALSLISLSLSFPARAGVDRWTPLASPLQRFVSPVVVDPERPATLYAVGTSRSQLWKSYDAGVTWTLLGDGLDPLLLAGRDLRGPAFDPDDSRRLWVWTAYTMWFSSDGGGHWTLRRGPADLDLWMGDVLPDSEVPERLLGLAEESSAAGGTAVVASRDGGATWAPVAHLPAYPAGANLLTHPSAPRVVYVSASSGLFRSGDGGETWSLFSTFGGHGFRNLVIAPSDPDTLYAVPLVAPGEILRSEDGGLTWAPTDLPEPRTDTTGPLVDPEDPLRVRAVVRRGGQALLLGSHDGGRSWTDEPLAVPSFTDPEPYLPTLVADPRDGRILYASPLLQKSTDGGHTWKGVGKDVQAGGVTSFTASRWGDRAVLYASQYDLDHHVLLRSGDSGARWRELPSAPDLHVVAADPHRGSRLWGLGLGVFRSDDHGVTWRPVLSGDELGSDPTDLLVDPLRPRRVFVGTMLTGVWRTDDAGETWVQSTHGLPLVDDCHHGLCPFTGPFAVDSGDARRVFVVMHGGLHGRLGLYRSLDGGARWHPVNGGLAGVNAVAAHPSRPGVLWAGTEDGVFASEDGGTSWSRMPGLSADVGQLLFDESTAQLYAVASRGIFRWPRTGWGDWEPLAAGLPEVTGGWLPRRGLVIDPTTAGRVYYTVPGLGVWTGRFAGAEPLLLPTGRFELRAVAAHDHTVVPGIPTRLSPERGSFALTFDGPPRLRVRLTAEGPYFRLSARAATEWDVELTAVDRLSGTTRSYRLLRAKPRLLVDERAFPVAPFTR